MTGLSLYTLWVCFIGKENANARVEMNLRGNGGSGLFADEYKRSAMTSLIKYTPFVEDDVSLRSHWKLSVKIKWFN